MREVIESAIKKHTEVLRGIAECLSDIDDAGELLKSAMLLGKKILICGNGGSAADSQHFAAEWVCKYKNDRRPYPAIALTTDSSVLTAIGNDYGFEEIFSRQIIALGSEGDVLIAFTTSGASLNIKRAIEAARTKNMKIIILTGQKGVWWKNEKNVNCAIIIPSQETARIQEMHELIYHAWCEGFDDATGVK